jgi:hypothetical protein
MPRASSTSAASSSRCSHDSEHFPYCYIDLDHCMNALCQQEDIAIAINLTNNDQTAFTEIVFLDYLFQTIQTKEKQLEKEKQLAHGRITRLLSKKSSDQLYQWIINTNLDIPSRLPIGSPHTPLETHTPSSISHSSHSPKPKPAQIRQYARSEIDRINHRWEFLLQNFLEDHPEGMFTNPILIEDDDNNEDVVLLSEK